MSVVCKSFRQIEQTGKIGLFKSYRPDYQDGEQRRDFVYVKDCCDVMLWMLEQPSVAGVFNLGTGQARSWNDLAQAVFTAMGRRPNIEYIEMPEVLRPRYQYLTEASMDKLRQAGYRQPFTTLEEGVEDYVTNYLSKADSYL